MTKIINFFFLSHNFIYSIDDALFNRTGLERVGVVGSHQDCR